MKKYKHLIIFSIKLVCIACVLSSCSEYKPKANEILKTKRWKPFIKDCKVFEYARSSYDNGGMIFVMSPDVISASEYFNMIENDAVDTGWKKIDTKDTYIERRPLFLNDQENYIHDTIKSNKKIQVIFSRKLFPNDHNDKTIEIVDLSFIEDKGVVIFISFYLSN